MVPLFDTDLADERYKLKSWENFELFEKSEVRRRRARNFKLGFALMAFLIVSSIPVIIERFPKWQTYRASRHLAMLFSGIKSEVAHSGKSLKVQFTDRTLLKFSVFQVEDCKQENGTLLREGSLLDSKKIAGLVLLDDLDAHDLEIPRLKTEFCFDPIDGTGAVDDEVFGYAFIDVKDLADRRIDRVSTLLVVGQSAEISLE